MTQSASIRQITIIGTGLIGGSFALALRKHGFRGQIVGCDQPKVLARAKRIGAIHVGISDPIKACNGSEVVVLATPVGTIIELMERLAHHLPSETMLTDVGRTKAHILSQTQQSFYFDTLRRYSG